MAQQYISSNWAVDENAGAATPLSVEQAFRRDSSYVAVIAFRILGRDDPIEVARLCACSLSAAKRRIEAADQALHKDALAPLALFDARR